VANGKEALASLRNISYDLVLMDCQMPEINGYEATMCIRDPQSGVRNSRIPIVALTAPAMQGDRDECLAAGMNDYIAKPVDSATLAAVLDGRRQYPVQRHTGEFHDNARRRNRHPLRQDPVPGNARRVEFKPVCVILAM
jgi:CheY-like chemotaxis protein